MDDINLLLTEVSLQILGNSFYDIYGQKRETLRELYLPSVEKRPGYSVGDCDLLVHLDQPPKEDDDELQQQQQQQQQSQQQQQQQQQRNKRPAVPESSSAQLIAAKSTANTMATFRKTALGRPKILARNHQPQASISGAAAAEANRSAATSSSRLPVPDLLSGATQRKASVKQSVEDELKECVQRHTKQKHANSESLKVDYFMSRKYRMDTDRVDEAEIVAEFHAAEKKQLMADSEALIRMVNMVKTDPKNAHKIAEISANILNVKDKL